VVVQVLLHYRAMPDVRGRGGGTPLAVAAEGGHVRVVQSLLEKGADRNPQDEQVRQRRDHAVGTCIFRLVGLWVAGGTGGSWVAGCPWMWLPIY
jgi:ankyrin repeat protein